MPDAQSRPPGPRTAPDRDHPEAVGRYKIIRRLGEGGMGSVFLAHDTILRREVALKLPLIGTENDPEVRERFLVEARSAATLDHPYICRVYDADVVDGRLYLAMAYIEGKSLADLIRAEGMPPRQVVALVGKLAIALQEAHSHGVVHRDLKPRNIMIRTVGSKREPVIVDFGLARLESPDDARMTKTGQLMGTPAYMAPEQLRGKPDEIGPSCDIYALGVMLYELLTGRLPFVGPYPVLVAQVLTQPPLPPSAHRPGLDANLDAICLKAMAKEVSKRHASMMELATTLTEHFRVTPSVATSGQSVAPIERPVEGDSIPTGADTLVSQFLHGTTKATPSPIAQEVASDTSMASQGTELVPSPGGSKGRQPVLVVTSVILGLALIGWLIVFITDKGRVTVNVEDPISLAIDGRGIPLTDAGEPIVLHSGQHSLDVMWGDGHSETRKFKIKRGETTPLGVPYSPIAQGPVLVPKKAESPTLSRETSPARPAPAEPPSYSASVAAPPTPTPFSSEPPESRPSSFPGQAQTSPGGAEIVDARAGKLLLAAPKTVKNSIGMSLALIPAGRFWMGEIVSPQMARADRTLIREANTRRHVVITRSFLIGIHEVTQAEYFSVTESDPSVHKGENMPVDSVSWFDAVNFCNKLSSAEKLTPYYRIQGEHANILGGDGYRLPTEAEWEYASQGDKTGQRYEHQVVTWAWIARNSSGTPHPVGQKVPNKFGLHDMLGNAAEWCWDWYGDIKFSGLKLEPIFNDPHGPDFGTERVLKGGDYSWQTPITLTPARRSKGKPSGLYEHSPRNGFRVARDARQDELIR